MGTQNPTMSVTGIFRQQQLWQSRQTSLGLGRIARALGARVFDAAQSWYLSVSLNDAPRALLTRTDCYLASGSTAGFRVDRFDLFAEHVYNRRPGASMEKSSDGSDRQSIPGLAVALLTEDPERLAVLQSSEDDVEKATGCRLLWKLPNNFQLMAPAIDKGVPVAAQSNDELSRSFRSLAAPARRR